MSASPDVRRPDKVMAEADARALLARGFAGRLASADAAGQPYVTPLLYVWDGAEIWVHNTAARGHLRANVEANDRVCFEVNEAGPVFAYGRFECDTGMAYESVVVFGRIRVVADRAAKQDGERKLRHQIEAERRDQVRHRGYLQGGERHASLRWRRVATPSSP